MAGGLYQGQEGKEHLDSDFHLVEVNNDNYHGTITLARRASYAAGRVLEYIDELQTAVGRAAIGRWSSARQADPSIFELGPRRQEHCLCLLFCHESTILLFLSFCHRGRFCYGRAIVSQRSQSSPQPSRPPL